MNALWLLLAGFGSGIAASMGFGGGFLLLLYLSFFTDLAPSDAGLLNLLFFLPIAAFSVRQHRRQGLIQTDQVKPAVVWGLLGIGLGFLVLRLLDTAILRQFFGGLTLLVGLHGLFFSKIYKK